MASRLILIDEKPTRTMPACRHYRMKAGLSNSLSPKVFVTVDYEHDQQAQYNLGMPPLTVGHAAGTS
jgi:hypothetical protein